MIGRKGQAPTLQAATPLGFDDFDLRLGDLMRGERATMGKSLEDISADLRIRPPYLQAIEDGDLNAFDTPSFIPGYVRSYARYLGMDGDNAFAKFCAETGFTVAHGMSQAASTSRVAELRARQAAGLTGGQSADAALFNRNFAPRPQGVFAQMAPGAIGSLALLLAVVLGLGYGGWAVLQEVQRVDLAPVDQAPVVADAAPLAPADARASAAADPAAADPVAAAGRADLPTDLASELASDLAAPSLTPGGDASARLAQPQALNVPVLVARDGPISAIDPRKAGALVETMANLAAQEEAAVQVLADAKAGVEVLAVRPSWVSVAAADGTVLFEKILDAGERYAVPALEVAPHLKAGNSSGIYFVVDGKTIGPAAAGPEVVKNLDLSAAALSARYAAADIAADADLAAIYAENAAPAPAPQPAVPQTSAP